MRFAVVLASLALGEWCGPAERDWCAGDPALFAEWEAPMPRGSTKWTAAERAAVRRWLAAPRTSAADLDLPRVFIYPFPAEFERMYALLETVPRLKLARFARNISRASASTPKKKK